MTDLQRHLPFPPDPVDPAPTVPPPRHVFGLGSSPVIIATLRTEHGMKIRPQVSRDEHTLTVQYQVLLFIVTNRNPQTHQIMMAIAGKKGVWGVRVD